MLEGTPTPRSYLRREDVDLPNGRALVHARRCVAVDRTASAARADFRGVNPDARVAVHGVDRAEDDVRLLKADIQEMIEPPISVEFDIKPSGGRNVVVIKVPEGKEPRTRHQGAALKGRRG